MLSLLPKVTTVRRIERKLRYIYRGNHAKVPVFGSVPCRITGCATIDAWSFLPSHHDPRRGVKHVIFSLPCRVPFEEKWVHTFSRFGKCFSERFCSGAPFVGALHLDTDQSHAELLFRNSDGKRALHWTKRDLHEMQSCLWIPKAFREFLPIVPARDNGFGHGSRTHPTQLVSCLLADYMSEDEVLALSENNSFAYSSVEDSPLVKVFAKTVRTIGLARGVEGCRNELGYRPETPSPVIIRPEMRPTRLSIPNLDWNPFAPPSAEELKAARDAPLHLRLTPEHWAPAMG